MPVKLFLSLYHIICQLNKNRRGFGPGGPRAIRPLNSFLPLTGEDRNNSHMQMAQISINDSCNSH